MSVPSSPRRRASDLADDEALARRLQFEEQARSANRDTQEWRWRVSEQERRDQQLAQHFARIDWQNHVRSESDGGEGDRSFAHKGDDGTASYLPHQMLDPPEQTQQQQQPSGHDRQRSSSLDSSAACSVSSSSLCPSELAAIAAISGGGGGAAAAGGGGGALGPAVASQSQDTAAQLSSPSDEEDGEDDDPLGSPEQCLEYARRLQAQAFSDLHNNTQKRAEQADRQLARRIQEMEELGNNTVNTGSNSDSGSNRNNNSSLSLPSHGDCDGSAMQYRGANANGNNPAHTNGKPSASLRGVDDTAPHGPARDVSCPLLALDDEELARFLQESGTSFRDLANAPLDGVLGSALCKSDSFLNLGNHSSPLPRWLQQHQPQHLPQHQPQHLPQHQQKQQQQQQQQKQQQQQQDQEQEQEQEHEQQPKQQSPSEIRIEAQSRSRENAASQCPPPSLTSGGSREIAWRPNNMVDDPVVSPRQPFRGEPGRREPKREPGGIETGRRMERESGSSRERSCSPLLLDRNGTVPMDLARGIGGGGRQSLSTPVTPVGFSSATPKRVGLPEAARRAIYPNLSSEPTCGGGSAVNSPIPDAKCSVVAMRSAPSTPVRRGPSHLPLASSGGEWGVEITPGNGDDAPILDISANVPKKQKRKKRNFLGFGGGGRNSNSKSGNNNSNKNSNSNSNSNSSSSSNSNNTNNHSRTDIGGDHRKSPPNSAQTASRNPAPAGERKPPPQWQPPLSNSGITSVPTSPTVTPRPAVPFPPTQDRGTMSGIPAPIPPPPGGSLSIPPVVPRTFHHGNHRPGPLPHSVSVSRNIAQCTDQAGNAMMGGAPFQGPHHQRGYSCCICGQSSGSLLAALDKTYHRECFRCVSCNERIDPGGKFAFSRDSRGEKFPFHRKCFAQTFGVTCAVCRSPIPASQDGTVSFVKHPFFDREQMCPRHAAEHGRRRCTGCHRFEPEGEPFADLNDAGRCVCYACCRTVIVDNNDVKPLWQEVMSFFEHKLKLPIWQDMRDIPILVVGSEALSDQMRQCGNVHRGSSQIMTRGLCLTSHDNCMRFKSPSMRFNESSRRFDNLDDEATGFTYFEVPGVDRRNPTANVFAILCMSGLPRDLTASILAHEATHAWIKLHPKYDFRRPLPAQVEEGVSQLIAMLFLSEGLGPPDRAECDEGSANGPSDEKLRQYFKFSIETDDNEVYGSGYRRAAKAYSDIGIEALMSHVVRYRKFPET